MYNPETLKTIAHDAIRSATDQALRECLRNLWDLHGTDFCTRTELTLRFADSFYGAEMLATSDYLLEVYCFLHGWRECVTWTPR